MKTCACIAALLATVIASACATTQGAIESGKGTLIRESVAIEQFGRNYRISGIVQANNTRTKLETFATDCLQGSGNISSPILGEEFVQFKNVLVSGNAPPDRLFAALCAAGLPQAERLEEQRQAALSQLTPDERAERARQNKLLVDLLLKQKAEAQQQRAEEARTQAVREAGREVSDAIRANGKSTTDCQPNGDGVTCRTR